MSDEVNAPKALPPPEQAPRPTAKRDLVPVVYGAGFVILAAGLVWLWRNPAEPPASGAMAALEQRLARLEQRPPPAPAPAVDIRPLEARLAALEQRPLPAAPDLRPLDTRLHALEQRSPPDIRPLESRLSALEQRPLPDVAGLATRVDALAGRQDALSARAQGIEAVGIARQDAAETRLAALEQAAARLRELTVRIDTLALRLGKAEDAARQVPALSERAARLARLQAAQAALEDGRKLGEMPGAPAALARFASVAPPTEAALRLAFPAAARAAAEASVPPTSDAPLLDRVWTRAQSLVTVRQGDRVLVGDPAAGVLARAKRALDAGDLAGAVAALGDLSGPAAQAMAAWRADAQALLGARAALAEMAAKI
jgi:hypothetical protein